jgi:transcriptional regulator with XRE-family HTH domain
MDKDLKYWYGMSDPAVLQLMGNFIKKSRLNRNRTQQDVSEAAGINRSTLVMLENGKGGTLLTYIQVLRALEQLHLLEVFEVKNELSPLQLAELEMKMRRRARRKASPNNKQNSSW